MSVREDIHEAAWAVARGQAPAPAGPGFCLQLVRMVVERALGWPSHELYRRYVDDTWVQPEGYDRNDGHWARDAERALRAQGWWVAPAEARPGDLLFNWRAAWSDRWGAYIGHAAIALSEGLILENVDPAYRPGSLSRGATVVSPREVWTPSTGIRFRPEG